VAQPPPCVDETLVALAFREIEVDNMFDYIGHLIGVTPGEQFADRRRERRIAAQRDLIGFLALFFEPENADRADVVMAASVDAARNLYASFPIRRCRSGSEKRREIACAIGIERAVASAQ